MKTRTIATVLCAAMLAAATSRAAIVYESFNYAAGGFNGRTADAGLGPWVNANNIRIAIPGLTYIDASATDLLTKGNRLYTSYKTERATANILTNGWSASSLDGARLNARGATIWWSFLFQQDFRDNWECYRVSLLSSNGGYIGFEDTTSGANDVKFVGKPDGGTLVTGGMYDFVAMGKTLIVMKMVTDASANTAVSLWFNPPIGAGEAGLPAPTATLNIPADTADGVLHFDSIRIDNQLGHSANLNVDEIRMGESFYAVTPTPSPIRNLPASGILDTSAWLNAFLSAADTNFDIYVHWGDTDGKDDPGAWDHESYVGSWTNVGAASLSVYTGGLDRATTYYYTFRATNDGTNVWAVPSQSFTTLDDPVVTSAGVTNGTTNSATLQGMLVGGTFADATICWGGRDAGTNSTADWDHAVPVGTVYQGAVFSTQATGLVRRVAYFYRCYATNALGMDWSDPAIRFRATHPDDVEITTGMMMTVR